MEVLLVRSVEKVLDAVNGRIQHTQWNAPLEPKDALKILQVKVVLLFCVYQHVMHMQKHSMHVHSVAASVRVGQVTD